MATVTLIDYKEGGNLFSVKNSLEHLGADVLISSDPQEIQNSSRVIFPGVGSFDKAIKQIDELKLREVIISKANSSSPFLGICVGMQVLFNSSSESKESTEAKTGLGIINAEVSKFPEKDLFKIPQIGWNSVQNEDQNPNPLFKGIDSGAFFYFVHSYMVEYSSSKEAITKQFPKSIFSTTQYSCDFVSSYFNGENLFACQFHPEKSAENGLKLLKNFLDF